MKKSEIYDACYNVADRLALALYDDEEGVALTNGEVDFSDKGDVSRTKRLLSEAKKELKSLGIKSRRIRRVDDVLYFNIDYPK